MQYTINQLRQEVFQNVYAVYDVFKNYFGEEYTDLQRMPSDADITNYLEDFNITLCDDGCHYEGHGNSFNGVKRGLSGWRPFILVYWPRVKVTNENNKSIFIQDLYAKIEIDSKGNIPTENGGFLLNRATYTMDQWVSNYMHSHICSIPKSVLEQFQKPCLGSGPINDTIRYLKSDLSEGFDEIRWMLFCEELARYVTVESLAGIPYNHLEEVHLLKNLSYYTGFEENTQRYHIGLNAFHKVLGNRLEEFILYYLDHGHLAVNYQQGNFICGMSYFDYIIDVSNAFIDWFNSTTKSLDLANACFTYRLLYHTVVAGHKFFDVDGQRSISDVSSYIGRKVCDFKGQEVKLNILEDIEQKPQETTVLNHYLAMFIINNILKIINYHYTNEYNKQHCQDSFSRDKTVLPATTGKSVYFL